MARGNGARVTLAVLGSRLEDLTGLVKSNIEQSSLTFKEIQQSLDGCDEYPGVRGRLDRLEQKEKFRQRQFNYVWTALVGMGSALLGLIAW